MTENKKYRSVSIPTGVTKDIEKLIEELGYWPSVGAFVREAAVKLVTEWQDRLKEKSDRAGKDSAPETAPSKEPERRQGLGCESTMQSGEAENRNG